MGAYSPNNICRKGITKAGKGINYGFSSYKYYTISDIIIMQPRELSSEILLSSGEIFDRVYYPHLMFRVLAVHGIYMICNSKPKERMLQLHRLNMRLMNE